MIQVGDVFNRLKVIEINIEPPKEKTYAKKLGKWCKCECKCQKIVTVPEASLINGSTQSCGCYKSEMARQQLEINRKNGIVSKPNAYKITFENKTQTLTEWAKDIGITKQALSRRLKKMPLEKALTKEVKHGN